jgi:hypothetical protein
VVDEITRAVIGKARLETRFVARAVRVDSTVVEADVRYPWDAVLALQGARVLAREGRKLARRSLPAHRDADRAAACGRADHESAGLDRRPGCAPDPQGQARQAERVRLRRPDR